MQPPSGPLMVAEHNEKAPRLIIGKAALAIGMTDDLKQRYSAVLRDGRLAGELHKLLSDFLLLGDERQLSIALPESEGEPARLGMFFADHLGGKELRIRLNLKYGVGVLRLQSEQQRELLEALAAHLEGVQ